MTRFLVDAQLQSALARWLAERGYEATHVADLGMASARDRAIWERAMSTGAVILTKDEDFALRRAQSTDGPAVVWLRCGNTRRRALLAWFEPHLPTVLEALARGECLIEIV